MQKGETWGREDGDIRDLVARFETAVANAGSVFFQDEDLERVIEHYQEEDKADKALIAVDFALEINPYNAVFHVLRADVLFELRRFEESMESAEMALTCDASELEAYFIQADIRVQWEQYEKALECLQEALQRADLDEHAEILIEMAEIHGFLEDFDAMFLHLRQALELNPDSDEALTQLWYCVDIAEKYEESIALHTQLLEEQPYAYLAWYNLGKAYTGMGLYEKALDAFGYVRAIEEKFGPVYQDSGEVLFRMERYREALEMFREAMDRNEPDEEIFFRLGCCREKLGEYNGARHHYRRALHLYPYFDEAYFRIGQTYLAQNNREQALRHFRKAIQLEPDNSEYRVATAQLEYDTDRVDQALISYREALRIRPDYPAHWVRYSRMLAENGDCEAAVSAASDAIAHCGELAVLYYLHSACLLVSGRRREGTLSLQRALDIDQLSHPVLFELFPELQRDQAVLDLIKQYNR